jgi:pSer/pThr/pTyr-binding forkhead associated (FHA) protein
MARLIVKNGELSKPFIDLKWGVTRLGRAEDNDFPIDHPSVSSHHCEVTLDLNAVSVRDLGSTNGTFVNGQPVQQAALASGQSLLIGDVEFVLEHSSVAVAVPTVPVERAPESVRLTDGTMSCHNHPTVRAARRCLQCRKMFCDPCIHGVYRISGPPLKLCPDCSGQTEEILWPQYAPKKQSLWGRFTGLFKRGKG